jgi:PAS domain-containing protein
VLISAIPETDENGQVVGSIAIVTSQVKRYAVSAIHRHIETSSGSRTLLKAVAEEISRLVPVDRMNVMLYSNDRNNIRSLFTYTPSGEVRWEVRWADIHPVLRELMRSDKIMVIDNLVQWFDASERIELQDSPDVQRFLAEGLLSAWRRPILRKGETVASISIYSKREAAYDQEAQNLLKSIPLEEAVQMALAIEEKRDLMFRLSLRESILLTPASLTAIADIFVDAISQHYEWENVSLFHVDDTTRRFAPLSQKGELLLPEGYTQSLDEGILGEVYHSGCPIRVGDIDDSPYAKIFKQVYKKRVISVLCMPISCENKICMLLNMEDTRRNAFAYEEQEALQTLLQDVGMLIHQRCISDRLNAILKTTMDMVIQTNQQGIIKEVNPATCRILGYEASEMEGKPLQSYLKDAKLAENVVKAPQLAGTDYVFLGKDGVDVKILLSCATLEPAELERKVYVGSDLSLYKRMEEIDFLRVMYNDLAMQIKTPLALVFTWLRRLEQSDDEELKGTVRKMLQQLRKVDLTFDRLMFYERQRTFMPYNEVLIDLSQLIRKILDGMPDSESRNVRFSKMQPTLLLRGDIGQLSFCIETILSYLLRFASKDDTVGIKQGMEEGLLLTEFSGRAPFIGTSDVQSYEQTGVIARTLVEMQLGEGALHAIAEQNHGELLTARDGNIQRIVLKLPVTLEV